MTSRQPGERPDDKAARRLAEAPSARLRPDAPATSRDERSALLQPLVRATLAGIAGALVVVLIGGVVASTTGLLVVSGATGAAVGLLLARAAVPDDDRRPIARRRIAAVAAGVAIASAVAGDAGLWLLALAQGGVLGPLDFLWTTFELLLPSAAIVSALAAWWGAHAGPIRR